MDPLESSCASDTRPWDHPGLANEEKRLINCDCSWSDESYWAIFAVVQGTDDVRLIVALK